MKEYNNRDTGYGIRDTGPCPVPRSPNPGFTMVELLVVTAMIAVISLATYSVFNSGIKLWQRVQNPSTEEGLAFFLDKFESDIRNTFNFSVIPFQGEEYRISMPAHLNKSGGIGRVIYIYSPGQMAMARLQMDYPDIYNAGQIRSSPALSGIRSLSFSFYAFDEELKEYVWLNHWPRQEMPLAVRVSLELGDKNENKKFTRTVSIPVSG